METLITIPTRIDEMEIKTRFFSAVNKAVLESFFSNRDEKLVFPKNMKYTAGAVGKDNNGKTTIDIIKCKSRVDMPKEQTFMIDTMYIKAIEKEIKNKKKLYGNSANIRGLVFFPVVDEKKIYAINIEKINKKNKDSQYVKTTYSDDKTLREGVYYYIPKTDCIVFDIKNIEFEKEEIKVEKQSEQKVYKNLF